MKKLVIFALLLSVSTAAIAGGYGDKVKKIKSPKGTTLTGVVYCGDEPLAGVSVTDGREIVKTDKNGVYRIASTKPYGLVYISAPSGFAPTCDEDGIMPQFWASTAAPAKKCERHDFELKKVDDKQFSIIFCSDSHFCNDPKRNDLHFFKTDHMAAVNKAFADAKGHPVYTVCLGDITWDRFWFATGFDLPQVPKLLSECNYPTPVFTIMGNHDNDPTIPAGENTDLLAENKYREVFGPTFYSMNIGDTHFVMLDDIVYKNELKEGMKLAPGVVGSRNYDCYVSPAQLEWLKKDLASIDKATPLVICMHAPFLARNAKGNVVRGFKKGENENLTNIIKDFDCVRIFSGHKHQSHFFEVKGYQNITETNIPATCGELWDTGNRIGRNICDDGADAGLLLCSFDGKDITNKTFYGHRDNMPVRMYDMNSVRGYYTDGKDSAILSHARELLPNQTNYTDAQFENYVYINCWMCDKGTIIEVTEDGKPLIVEPIKNSDPFASIAIIAPNMRNKKKLDKHMNTDSLIDHLFRVKTESATTPVTVTVKTPFGKTYTQTLERPAEFPNF